MIALEQGKRAHATEKSTQTSSRFNRELYVIGTNQEIRDDAAIAFSTGFYQALGYGRSFQYAYRCGCKAIELQISNGSIDPDAIAEYTRKLVPINDVSEAIIIPEHLKPVFKKKPLIHPEHSDRQKMQKMLEEHYKDLIKAIQRNKVVFFLGSDLNFCDRQIQSNDELESWKPGCKYPRSPDARPPLTLKHQHFEGVNALAFSPDGKMLASGGKDGKVGLWNLDKPDLREWSVKPKEIQEHSID